MYKEAFMNRNNDDEENSDVITSRIKGFHDDTITLSRGQASQERMSSH
jgi:hypothetical protein